MTDEGEKQYVVDALTYYSTVFTHSADSCTMNFFFSPLDILIVARTLRYFLSDVSTVGIPW